MFDMDEPGDIAEYEVILNDPLCSVTFTHFEVLTEKFFNEDGMMTRSEDRLRRLVEWDQKVLL